MVNRAFNDPAFSLSLIRGDLKSHLVLLSKTADSIADGDLVDRRIRSGQNWSLLPSQVTHMNFRGLGEIILYVMSY